jgi:purine-binding chemotaxis protein CheW
MENQLVIFKTGNEHYGVDIAAVESIIKVQDITSVPRAPEFVEGITNLRGTVLPVIDLRKRFGLAATESTKDTRIVVIEMNGSVVGMIVDAVTEVLRISPEAIEPPSPLVTTIDSAFITGIAKVDGRLVILLDLSKVFSMHEKIDLQNLQQHQQELIAAPA